jgi:hypothetical protein
LKSFVFKQLEEQSKMGLTSNKRAIGVFLNRQDAESALKALKNADFPMNQVSVVARDVSEKDEMAESESEFVREQTLKGIGTGAIAGGALLGGIGGLLAGLGTLAIPGLGPIAVAGAQAALAGTFAGGFYGAGAGGIIGAVIGNGVSQEQAKVYSDRLSQGDYLVMIDGTDDQIQRAESVLVGQDIQDWGVYRTI